MGVLNAMLTAVTGLSAQSYALENISGNIANSQTVGFRRVDTSFVDMIPDSPTNREKAGAVSAYSRLTNTLPGLTQTTGVTTNVSLNGNGWFVVQKNTGTVNAPTFGGTDLYTRRGDFAPDANGYLVNGSGNYLVGKSGPIKIDTTPSPAAATTKLSFQANLPALPKPESYSASVPNSELLSAGLASGTTVSADDSAAFLSQSIAGGDLVAYDSKGQAVTLETRWAKTASSSSGGADTWKLYVQSNAKATGAGTAYTQLGDALTFDSTGKLASAATTSIPSLTVNGVTIGPVTLDVGSGKLTQFGDSDGQVSGTNLTQDGHTAGSVTGLTITTDGQLSASYSNGVTKTIATVQVAHFKADDQLQRLDGGTYGQTAASGDPSYGMQGTSISAGTVEMSNTDIAEEFSKMIVTQQAYSANTRVISTAQQMLEDVINVVR